MEITERDPHRGNPLILTRGMQRYNFIKFKCQVFREFFTKKNRPQIVHILTLLITLFNIIPYPDSSVFKAFSGSIHPNSSRHTINLKLLRHINTTIIKTNNMAQYLKNGLAMAICLITLYPHANYAQLDLLPCTCMTSSLEIVPENAYEIVIVTEEESEGFSWRYEKPEIEIPVGEKPSLRRISLKNLYFRLHSMISWKVVTDMYMKIWKASDLQQIDAYFQKERFGSEIRSLKSITESVLDLINLQPLNTWTILLFS